MIQQRSYSHTAGFTVVELMIAVAFISLLLLAIAATVMQIGAIYNKGVTMKSVNQAGRDIVADIKRTIGESQSFDIADAYKPHDFNLGSGGSTDYDGGRLCTGIYTYIWNIGKHVNPDDPSSQLNKYAGADSTKPIRLIRIIDSGGQYCKGDATGEIQYAAATELLSEGNLAVQDFHIERMTNNLASGTALYSINLTISNADTEAISTVDNRCKPPSEDTSYQDFCAVNDFSFTAQSGNKGGQ